MKSKHCMNAYIPQLIGLQFRNFLNNVNFILNFFDNYKYNV